MKLSAFYCLLLTCVFLLSFLGNVTENHTLFSISYPDYDPTFVPLFSDNIDTLFGNNTNLRNQALSLCGGTSNLQCLFDFALTADSQAVSESQSSLSEFETEQKKLSKYFKL